MPRKPTGKPPGRPRKPDDQLKWPRKKPKAAEGKPSSPVPTVRPAGLIGKSPPTVSLAPTDARHAAGERTQGALARPSTGASAGVPGRAGSGTRFGSFDEAYGLITAPEKEGEGWRLLALGNSGSGKTSLIRAMLARRWDGFTVIHDDSKRRPQYGSAVVRELAHSPDDASIVTLRGDPLRGIDHPVVDDVARLALELARRDVPVRLVVDELDRACTPGGKELASVALRDCLTKGRSMALSCLLSTQAPQRAPREVIDQATALALCQLGPRALAYLDDRLLFDTALLRVVETLPPLRFVIYRPGYPWNGIIYDCPHPSTLPAPGALEGTPAAQESTGGRT